MLCAFEIEVSCVYFEIPVYTLLQGGFKFLSPSARIFRNTLPTIIEMEDQC